MKDSKYYKKKIRCKDNINDKLWLTRLLLSIIIVLVCLITTNLSNEFKILFRKNVLEENISFTKFNELYNAYVGNNKELEEDDTLVVSGINDLLYDEMILKDGSYYINVGVDYPINFITSGLVVFKGDKDNFKNTIIVQGNNGIDVWYSGVLLDGYTLYDYVSKGDLLGNSLEENVIISFVKDGSFMTYEEFIKQV